MRDTTLQFDSFHRMAPLQMLYSATSTYILKVNNLNVNISETVRASEKTARYDADVDIRLPIAPHRILYFTTLTFIFNIRHFHIQHLPKTADIPGRFASTRTAPAVELLFRFHRQLSTRRACLRHFACRAENVLPLPIREGTFAGSIWSRVMEVHRDDCI